MSPSLPEDEIATRKGEVVTSIRQDDDNPAVRAIGSADGAALPDGHPYGRRDKGHRSTSSSARRAIGSSRLHAARFAPSRADGGRSSATSTRRAPRRRRRACSAAGGASAARRLPCRRRAPPTGRQRVVIPMMNKAQADIAYGFIAIARSDPAYYAFWLMNNVLGQYAHRRPARRQHPRAAGDGVLRVQRRSTRTSSTGRSSIRAGVSPANVDRAVASIDEELDAAAPRRRRRRRSSTSRAST